MSAVRPKSVRAEHPLEWLIEPLMGEPTFVLKSWFGGRTIMMNGMHHLFLTTQGEPWQGVLVCTFHEHHDSLRKDFPALMGHPILKKWLYLPEDCASFESDARRLVQRVRLRDPRIGIPPSPKKARAKRKIRFGDAL